jgi:hypothetical protein
MPTAVVVAEMAETGKMALVVVAVVVCTAHIPMLEVVVQGL